MTSPQDFLEREIQTYSVLIGKTFEAHEELTDDNWLVPPNVILFLEKNNLIDKFVNGIREHPRMLGKSVSLWMPEKRDIQASELNIFTF